MTSGSVGLGQQIGLSFGSFLGRQIALGACRDDAANDDFERRPFTLRTKTLPPAVDLRPWMTKVEDQGALGSCTSNALVGALEYLVRRETGREVDLSRLFVYYNQRLWDDCVRDDAGAAIAVGIRVLARLGVPTERSWPYDRNLFAVQPPEEVYREASQFQVTDWWSLPIEAAAIRSCLAAGFPIVFGTRCTESFMRVPASGVVPMPGAGESAQWKHGRHALLLVGYDDAARRFVIRNSWGADWGDRGYGYLPYEWVLNPEWTRSAWAIRLTERADLSPTAKIDPRALPAAPPSSGAQASGAVGAIASMGTQLAVGMITGSGMLAGLAGGLVQGITPGLTARVRGRDVGAFVGEDRSAGILKTLQADGKPPAQLARLPWDDGLDERAVVSAIGPTARAQAAVSAEPRANEPIAASPVAPVTKPMAPSGKPIVTAPVAAPSKPVVATPLAKPIAAPVGNEIPEAILAAWQSAGGKGGPLGMPMPPAGAMSEGDASGVAMRFANGGIFVWAGQKPIVLSGQDRLFASWLAAGAARSPVGWPTQPPMTLEDGVARGLPCARGAIFDHPRLGTHSLHGALYSYWCSLGGIQSGLGLPLEDAVVPLDPTASQTIRFEHGTLYWSPTTGPTRS